MSGYGQPRDWKGRPIERFMEKVDRQPDGCWLWTGSKRGSANQSYGQFHPSHKPVRAHRWSYEFFIGPIPEGLELDHLCWAPSCVNPLHLEAVTHRENLARRRDRIGEPA